MLFRVAAAEALFAGGSSAEAEPALREALRHIELRAARLADPALRRSYLERRDENRRAAAHARDWLGQYQSAKRVIDA